MTSSTPALNHRIDTQQRPVFQHLDHQVQKLRPPALFPGAAREPAVFTCFDPERCNHLRAMGAIPWCQETEGDDRSSHVKPTGFHCNGGKATTFPVRGNRLRWNHHARRCVRQKSEALRVIECTARCDAEIKNLGYRLASTQKPCELSARHRVRSPMEHGSTAAQLQNSGDGSLEFASGPVTRATIHVDRRHETSPRAHASTAIAPVSGSAPDSRDSPAWRYLFRLGRRQLPRQDHERRHVENREFISWRFSNDVCHESAIGSPHCEIDESAASHDAILVIRHARKKFPNRLFFPDAASSCKECEFDA